LLLLFGRRAAIAQLVERSNGNAEVTGSTPVRGSNRENKLSICTILCYSQRMLTKQKGDIALGQAIQHFLTSDYEVCLPIGDKRDYDLIIEKEGILSRVQVKYAGFYPSKNNTCRVGLRITGGNQSYHYAKHYSDDAFDILFVYTARGQCYMLPWADVVARNELYIEHDKYSRYLIANAMQG
jgi:hypothetical protein